MRDDGKLPGRVKERQKESSAELAELAWVKLRHGGLGEGGFVYVSCVAELVKTSVSRVFG